MAERRVGNEPDAELTQQRQDLVLDITCPERVFGLQRGDRLDCVCTADRVGACFREPEVPHLPLRDQLGDCSGRFLDGVLRSTRCW